jgi:hypothetical protein
MSRTLTIFAVVTALAVSAGAAAAGASIKPPTQSLTYTLNNTMVSGFSAKAPPTNGLIMRDGAG